MYKPKDSTGNHSKEYVLKRVTLTIEKFCEVTEISHGTFMPDVYLDYATERMLLRISQYLLTDKKEGTIVRSPLTPLEFFKEKYAPKWLIKRYPVKYKETKIDFRVMYPDYKLSPDQLGRRFIDILETK